jgi:hypothetical protein
MTTKITLTAIEPRSADADLLATERVVQLTPPDDAIRHRCGCRFLIRRGGGQESASPTARLQLTMSAWRSDGVEVARDLTLVLSPRRLPAGLSDVLSQLNVGDQMSLWLPTELAVKVWPRFGAAPLLAELRLLRVVA